MRRKKNRSRLLPFGAGLAGVPSDHRRCGGGSAGDVADRRGQFHGVADGGSGGAWELPLRQDCGGSSAGAADLKQARLGGVLFGPLVLGGLNSGTVQGNRLPVKAALCIGFAAAGEFPVNSPEK